MINSKRKGKRFELAVVHELRAWPGLKEARRGLTQSRGALEPDVVADWPWWIECKSRSALTPALVTHAMAQAERDIAKAGSDKRPMVVFSRVGLAGPVKPERYAMLKQSDPDLDISVFSLTSLKSRRNLMLALSTLPPSGALTEGGDVFCRLETVKELWLRARARRAPDAR